MKYLDDFNTIIWDWNGTLLDDCWLGVAVMDSMLRNRKMPGLTMDLYREIFDFPVKDYYAKLGFDFSLEPFEKVGNEFIEKYNAQRFECKLRPYAIEVLSWLKEKRFRQFVLSARNHQYLDEEFEFHGIHHFFEHFKGLPDNWANGKISLGAALIDIQQIDKKKTLLIGDTFHDFEVARGLGIQCILLEGGHQSKNRLNQDNVLVLKGLEEVLPD